MSFSCWFIFYPGFLKRKGDTVLPADAVYLNQPDNEGKYACGGVADCHDKSHADTSKVCKILQEPQHRHPEYKYAAEIDGQSDFCFAKAIEQGQNRSINSQGDCSESFKAVDRSDHSAEFRVRACKQAADLI